MDVPRMQKALQEHNLDGWLFYDFHNRDPIAYRVLGLDINKLTSRRWFYYVPAAGDPIRLVHRVEPAKLDPLPGEKRLYLAWEELHASLKEILGKPAKRIAMQYSPRNAIPYVSMVDAGTVELVRGFGHDVVSSADLVQVFEAVLDEEGYRSHLEALGKIHRIKDEAFRKIESGLKAGETLTEYGVQRFIAERFEAEALDCMNDFPIVGVNDHPANPHFEPTPENAYTIRKGDTILIDLWAKTKSPGSVFADITWCGYAGTRPPDAYTRIFRVVCDARDAALNFVKDRFAQKQPCHGWEVDRACRNVVAQAGFGDRFIHRTGHSIGQTVHGNGVHMDDLETKEERTLIPGICFSIEPGIYLAGEMAVRTEIDVFISHRGVVEVGGPVQQSLVLLEV